MSTLDDRLAALDAELAPLPGVLVAFSGGVDSGVVLAAAVRTLGPGRVVAATAVSPSLPATERVAAAEFAASLGVRHEQPRTDELSREGYRANAGDRCAFCKAELVDVLTPLAVRLGIADVVTGTNADDLRAGFRPGIRAAAERGAWAPLARAGLTKDDVRAAARRWGLPLADKPAAACLASRIAYGVPVSADGLARVEAAEAALRAALDAAGLAVANLRVRDLGSDIARVEVDRALVDRMTPELLAAVAGFDRVEVDPRGFRSGSMNELLPDPVRYR
ncbi:MAG: ATP-dependent sacrificial sulfur transferase LarE [Blastococcus sp.]